MDPEISRFPSSRFYNKKLIDAECVTVIERRPHLDVDLGPYTFVDVKGDERRVGQSLCNDEEARLCVELAQKLSAGRSSSQSVNEVSIITFYAGQVSLIRSELVRQEVSKVPLIR